LLNTIQDPDTSFQWRRCGGFNLPTH